jgi:hypothetical protein
VRTVSAIVGAELSKDSGEMKEDAAGTRDHQYEANLVPELSA